MDLPYILCVFVLSVLFLSDFVVLSCVAAIPSCPARSVAVSAAEVEGGYKCVCRRNYYGTNCRFKARSKSIDADAQWLTNTSAIVTWQGHYGENFRLSVRRIIYRNNGTVYSPSKWFQAKVTSTRMELYGDISTGVMLKPGTPGKVTAVLHFRTQNANYEVHLAKITSTGDVNGSVSIFLDSDNILVLDKKNISRNQSNETIKCAWYECPAQFFHVTAIMDDFGKPCFIHGAIVAVPINVHEAKEFETKQWDFESDEDEDKDNESGESEWDEEEESD
ncbi:---NA--- [Paramuricea clavata]|uniref:---NA n=1 Tax=Paramuricea clavata TaxID=317549 RepID=A0A7D9DAV6_PARCT|nr:---NA--- [Paramuricea clavata]